METILLISVPMYGTIVGKYKGESLPSGGPYLLTDVVSAVISPDGRIGMARLTDVFSDSLNEITTTAPYVVLDEKNPIVSAYKSSISKIVVPQNNKNIVIPK